MRSGGAGDRRETPVADLRIPCRTLLAVAGLAAAGVASWIHLGGVLRGPYNVLVITVDTLRADRLVSRACPA